MAQTFAARCAKASQGVDAFSICGDSAVFSSQRLTYDDCVLCLSYHDKWNNWSCCFGVGRTFRRFGWQFKLPVCLNLFCGSLFVSIDFIRCLVGCQVHDWSEFKPYMYHVISCFCFGFATSLVIEIVCFKCSRKNMFKLHVGGRKAPVARQGACSFAFFKRIYRDIILFATDLKKHRQSFQTR